MGTGFNKKKKDERKMAMESTIKFTQGTIWHWGNKGEQRAGVQSGERPVLIVSNNTFNKHSPVVNCVCITSVLKDSPVHVPLHVNRDSHIQCEQIHTISKEDLQNYIGTASAATMNMVKEKLRFQFDMTSDNNTAILNSIKKSVEGLEKSVKMPPDLTAIKASVDALCAKAEKGFGVPEIEDTFLQLVADLHKIVTNGKSGEVLPAPSNNRYDESHVIRNVRPYDSGKQTRRNYSEEDKKFILDKRNSTEVIMKKYGFKDKKSVFATRAYFKRKKGDEN